MRREHGRRELLNRVSKALVLSRTSEEGAAVVDSVTAVTAVTAVTVAVVESVTAVTAGVVESGAAAVVESWAVT
jgi:hypothetical protein